jgi:hypothetical protein
MKWMLPDCSVGVRGMLRKRDGRECAVEWADGCKACANSDLRGISTEIKHAALGLP